MISALEIRDPKTTCVPWWGTVEWLKGMDRIDFRPGLNILWGPNGSGKSTVILAMARMLHCRQGGRSCVTVSSVREVFSGSAGNDTMLAGALPVHDGKCVRMFDSGHTVGLFGGAFDDDFFREGVNNTLAMKASAGQRTLHMAGDVLDGIVKGAVPEVEWKVPRPSVAGHDGTTRRDFWNERYVQVEDVLRGGGVEGPPTFLMDEPDRSMEIIFQHNFWRSLAEKWAGSVQIIAASHSPFALGLPGAHYIETVPGYMRRCVEAIRTHGERFTPTGRSPGDAR